MTPRANLCAVVLTFLAIVWAPAEAAERVLSIDEAVEIALTRNPELLSLSAEMRAADARVSGASLLVQDNPEIGALGGQRRRPGERKAEYEIEASQRLEIFGQRAARIDVARAGRAAAGARLQTRRVELASEVRQVFARALAAEALVAVARDGLKLAREAVATAERRFELGDGTRMETNTARVEIGRAARELSLAQRARLASIGELRLLLGIPADETFTVAGDLVNRPTRPRLDAQAALVREAMKNRPEVELARQELAGARAEQRQAAREAYPSPRLRALVGREEGAMVLLGGIALDLPLFNRNQGPRGVAAARSEQAERALEAVERRVAQDVALAVSRLSLAEEASQAYEGDVVRAMEENLKLVTTAYQAGKVGVFELLVLRRDTLEARRGYIEASQELLAAHAELERALGRVPAAATRRQRTQGGEE
jgi:outer membrane protein, heavy metal efflux system